MKKLNRSLQLKKTEKRNMKKLVVSIIPILLFTATYSQNDRSFREPFQLELAVDTINYYSQEIPKSPYFVKENIIQIYPSEQLFIEVSLKDSTIETMKVVKENLFPEKTIRIDFKQNKKGKIHQSMMLTVQNPFDKKLIYKANMYIVGYDKWLSTSIMPVNKKLSGIEIWNDIIITLVLSDWTLE